MNNAPNSSSVYFRYGADAYTYTPLSMISDGSLPHPDMDLADWVLSRFTPDDDKAVQAAFANAADAAELIVQGNIDEAMNRFNG